MPKKVKCSVQLKICCTAYNKSACTDRLKWISTSLTRKLGGKPLLSQKMGNQHFTINKAFRYDIWGEQTSTVASEIHLKNDYAD